MPSEYAQAYKGIIFVLAQNSELLAPKHKEDIFAKANYLLPSVCDDSSGDSPGKGRPTGELREHSVHDILDDGLDHAVEIDDFAVDRHVPGKDPPLLLPDYRHVWFTQNSDRSTDR